MKIAIGNVRQLFEQTVIDLNAPDHLAGMNSVLVGVCWMVAGISGVDGLAENIDGAGTN